LSNTTSTMTAQLDLPQATPGIIQDPAQALRFLLAGNAYVTLQSLRSGARFTYCVTSAGPGACVTSSSSTVTHFVKVLTAPDQYSYLGCIYGARHFRHGYKSRISPTALSTVAWSWTWEELQKGQISPDVQIFHSGRCGRCGRQLTVPESILSGLGPECAKRAS